MQLCDRKNRGGGDGDDAEANSGSGGARDGVAMGKELLKIVDGQASVIRDHDDGDVVKARRHVDETRVGTIDNDDHRGASGNAVLDLVLKGTKSTIHQTRISLDLSGVGEGAAPEVPGNRITVVVDGGPIRKADRNRRRRISAHKLAVRVLEPMKAIEEVGSEGRNRRMTSTVAHNLNTERARFGGGVDAVASRGATVVIQVDSGDTTRPIEDAAARGHSVRRCSERRRVVIQNAGARSCNDVSTDATITDCGTRP